MQGLPDILKYHNLQSLNKAFDLFIEFKFCESDFYFLNRSKNCMVATYNFGSVYRGSYMSARFIELRKRYKMRGLPSILSLLRNEFNKFNNIGARMLGSIYHMT